MKHEELLDLPRPASKHPKMDARSRAAQFAPFAALTGYSAVLAEIDRERSERSELDEEQQSALNEALSRMRVVGKGTWVRVRWFEKDAYRECTGQLRRWNEVERWIQLRDGTRICFEDLAVLQFLEEEACVREEE